MVSGHNKKVIKHRSRKTYDYIWVTPNFSDAFWGELKEVSSPFVHSCIFKFVVLLGMRGGGS